MKKGEGHGIVFFGDWVRRRRKALDLTQAALAERVGYATVTIKKIEQGARRPSRQMAGLLADHLNIPEAERDKFIQMGRGEFVALRPSAVTDIVDPSPPSQPTRLPSFLTAKEEPLKEKPRFVARHRELAQLQSHLAAALNGDGRAVFISGEAGRGKTMLMTEFARRAQNEQPNLIVAGGNCNAFTGVGDPYLPFRDLFRLLTGDLEARWAAGAIFREQAHRLWAVLPHTIQAIIEHGPHLIEVLISGRHLLNRAAAFAPDSADWLAHIQTLVQQQQQAQPEHLEQRQILEEGVQVMQVLAAQQPLLLLLDDLQWADGASINLLFHLGRRLAGSQIMIIGAYRASEVALGHPADKREQAGRHPLEPVVTELKRHYGDIQIDLDRFMPDEGRAFVEALLDSEPNRLSERFRENLFWHTKGHPLFTVELLRAMQESGHLVQDETGRWIEGAEFEQTSLPVRVEAVIQQRIDRLDESLRNLLMVASVAGEVFSAQVVASVQNVDEQQVLRQLSQELERHHRLVREHSEVKIGRQHHHYYQFGHVLFQQYLYRQLGLGERRLLHAEIAQALEGFYQEQLDEITNQLARHYLEAGAFDKAAVYLHRAGDQARRAASLNEAARLYRLALEHWPDSDQAGRAEILAKVGECRWVTGHIQEALEVFETAYALFETLGNLVKAGAMQRLMGRMHWELGDRETSLQHYHQALAILEQGPESIEQARTISAISQMYMLAAEYEQAVTWGGQALALAERLEAEDVIVHALNNVGTAIVLRDPERGLAMLEDSLGRALALNLPHDTCRAYTNRAENLMVLCRYAEARSVFEEQLAYATRIDAPLFAGAAVVELTKLDWLTGQWAEALARRQQILEWLARGQHLGYLKIVAHTLFGRMHNDLGRFELAREELGKELSTARSAHELQTTVPHLGQLARAYAAQGLEPEAAEIIQEYLELIERASHFGPRSISPLLFSCRWLTTQTGPDALAAARGCLHHLERGETQIGSPETAAALSEGRGSVTLVEENFTDAVTYFRHAAARWAALGRPYDQARVLRSLGQALTLTEEAEEAKQAFTQAKALAESLATQLEDTELKLSFLNSKEI